MIVILKLAFCLRAIGEKTWGKTTVETPEGKREARGVSPPAQRHATKSVTSPSAQKVTQHNFCRKLPLPCSQQLHRASSNHLLLAFRERIGDFSAGVAHIARKEVVRGRGDLVMFQYAGRFQAQQLFSGYGGIWTVKLCWSRKCDPFFFLV